MKSTFLPSSVIFSLFSFPLRVWESVVSSSDERDALLDVVGLSGWQLSCLVYFSVYLQRPESTHAGPLVTAAGAGSARERSGGWTDVCTEMCASHQRWIFKDESWIWHIWTPFTLQAVYVVHRHTPQTTFRQIGLCRLYLWVTLGADSSAGQLSDSSQLLDLLVASVSYTCSALQMGTLVTELSLHVWVIEPKTATKQDDTPNDRNTSLTLVSTLLTQYLADINILLSDGAEGDL